MYDTSTRAQALELVYAGHSRNAVSRRLGVSRSTLRRWLSDPEGAGGGARPCPVPLEPSAAYSALLGYYLGDGHIARFPRYYALRIACDARYGRIIDDVGRLLHTVHPDRPVFRVRASGCVVVQSNWKHWPCLFPQHGPGPKHQRQLVLTDWQRRTIAEEPGAFLRGLFHSDGCLVKNWATRPVGGRIKRYEYPRWQFVNESRDIMQWCGEALDRVGVRWRQTKPRVLSVSRRDDVARLTALIGEKG
ncbi:helix-turn-helix domain-containing protein [Marmoricola sp. RAF53]|uniref:helix-turn-helix domain-containing protein n=1 Tax=Marmoricola sp. RAF53 TaxID=3233059 RepID=UPI003F96023D